MITNLRSKTVSKSDFSFGIGDIWNIWKLSPDGIDLNTRYDAAKVAKDPTSFFHNL